MPRTALVTGAGSGMGRAIAATLAEKGLEVALVGRDRRKLERVRDELGGKAIVEPCDVADRASVGAMVGRVRGLAGAKTGMVDQRNDGGPARGDDEGDRGTGDDRRRHSGQL